MKTWKIAPAIAAMFLIASAALGYFIALNPGTYASSNEKLKLAISPWPGYEPLYLAEIMKFYEVEGVDVQLVQFSTLDDARRSFERGQVDAIATTLVDVVQIYFNTGAMPKIALALDHSNGADVVLAKSSRFSHMNQLRGKTIAVEQMFGRFVLDRALSKHGLTLSDVKIIESSVTDAGELLQADKVDAIVTFPPYSIESLNLAGTVEIFNSKEAEGEIADVLAIRDTYLSAHPKIVARLRKMWQRAITYVDQNKAQAFYLMAMREGISAQEFETAFSGIEIIRAEHMDEMLADGGPIASSIEHLIKIGDWKMPVKRKVPVTAGFFYRATAIGTGS